MAVLRSQYMVWSHTGSAPELAEQMYSGQNLQQAMNVFYGERARLGVKHVIVLALRSGYVSRIAEWDADRK